MDTETVKSPVKRAPRAVELMAQAIAMEPYKGNMSALARAVGCKRQQMEEWADGSWPVPGNRVLKLEELTGISRHRWRPDIFGAPPSPPPSEGNGNHERQEHQSAADPGRTETANDAAGTEGPAQSHPGSSDATGSARGEATES